MTVIDAFAGAGGWDLALRELGIEALGIEFADSACATRRAAGLRTLQGDVAALDPLNFAPCSGFAASPPCPTYSSAGGRAGALLTEIVLAALRDLAAGRDTREQRRQAASELLVASGIEQDRARRDADMSLLVVEPLRWALALEPEWIALEQVPPVLPIWRAVGEILRARGYSVWTGILEAERYGVPQTRERAILMASRTRTVQPPRPTHQRYVPGEPARHEHTLEGEVLPWVSMAQALGMVDGAQPAPAPTVSGGGPQAGGGVEVFAGRDARRRAALATSRGQGMVERHGERPVRELDEPAFTVTGKTRSAEWVLRNGNQANACERAIAATGCFVGRQLPPGEGRNVGGHGWVTPLDVDLAPCGCEWDVIDGGGFCACCYAHLEDPRGLYAEQGDGTHQFKSCPAWRGPASTAELQSADWPERRPATTIAGDPRVFQPGGHHEPGQQSANAVRVTIEQAAILQTFPADYPWQGSRSAQYLQCGNAVPPLLALAVLSMLVEPAESARAAA